MGASVKTERVATPRKAAVTQSPAKKKTRPNASILTFFQKAEKPETSLFVGSVPAEVLSDDDDIYEPDAEMRYNEVDSPLKRQKLCEEHGDIAMKSEVLNSVDSIDLPAALKRRTNTKAPFIMDSDSDSEIENENEVESAAMRRPLITPFKVESPVSYVQEENEHHAGLAATATTLRKRDKTDLDNSVCLEDLEEDPDLDDFVGEELRERRFMLEHARLEAEEAGELLLYQEQCDDDDAATGDNYQTISCPICSGSLIGVSEVEASRHVNGCLDGEIVSLPVPPDPQPSSSKKANCIAQEVDAIEVGKRFAKAAVPRPGQTNPLDMSEEAKRSKSAFAQLMTGNAEDTAWAAAAAAEHASRGKPAYERTCPFYKIMPGFSICVDAFRYGAVEGCEAYFLSHFHSDHYIGLTANWTHGPIYCSEVTASLVKQQLRTAAKWIVGLEFDKEYDVPGTNGATVTMLPANHCPGSSIFIFEKKVGVGSGQKTKRILHCGDFRACPQHVRHPLLKPDIRDSVTGKLRQQKIDICYLDTTYLNPRYSFPPQEDVIRASAELCASISPDPHCKDDIWERSKQPQGTASMSRYFQPDKPVVDDTLATPAKKLGQRLLVICGTYSIGKERICVAIAKALGSKIFASPSKIKICRQLGDPELASLLTSDPLEAQVHMQMIMEIRAETLQEYLNSFKPHFSRIVGFRPSGWNFRPTNGKPIAANIPPSSIPTQQILHGKLWKARFGAENFIPQRGSTKEAMCFGVPYSEHSSFRELALFVMSLRVEKVIPTVNVGSEPSRKRMKAWIDRWTTERRKGGIVQPLEDTAHDGSVKPLPLWDGKTSTGGGVWW